MILCMGQGGAAGPRTQGAVRLSEDAASTAWPPGQTCRAACALPAAATRRLRA